MLTTKFSATWFARELRSARRTALFCGMPYYAALVSPYGQISTGTGWGFGRRPVYRRGKFMGTVALPCPMPARRMR